MNNFQKGMFDKINQKSNISPDEIYKVADSVKHADFSDEKTVRELIQRLSRLANKPVSKEKEDKIVEAIVKNKVPMNSQTMNNLFDK
ncbi:stage VI sporulation protein F [Oceanobacillus alkalisoli]|uniref:stage VI sporulation protein F n=1 Tax=Oceanobacillus alkalisoli TaxID=2925113 RepID=UPI001EF0E1A8|nr:stage VI sporulation protein F [Oceanobacillus alkalisoli]MCF3941650.1 stage VI sporulation protein F [Oceanobacillus alkalisoli]MCG5102932.1 stage VI sporulation protein F [Oceanobacillus alkalisoli]